MEVIGEPLVDEDFVVAHFERDDGRAHGGDHGVGRVNWCG